MDAACEDGQRELRLYAFPRAILDWTFLPSGTVFVEDSRDPDIVALRTGRCTPAEMQRQIVRARWRFGWGPLLVAHYGEIAADPKANLADLDAVFSFAPTAGKNCRHERYWRSPHLAQHVASRETRAPDSLWARPKTRFCNFVYSNSNFSDTSVREGFAQLLMRHERVDCPGRVLNNTTRLPPYRSGSYAGRAAKLVYQSSYRFTIAFENTSADHYVTEKIVHALSVGSIPIYWGCPQVAEYYNPDAFVNCHAFDSFDEVVERVMELEADPEQREIMRRAPVLQPGSRVLAAHRDLEACWLSLSARAPRRRGCSPSPARRCWRWMGLLGRAVLLELDPRPRACAEAAAPSGAVAPAHRPPGEGVAYRCGGDTCGLRLNDGRRASSGRWPAAWSRAVGGSGDEDQVIDIWSLAHWQ